MKFSLGFRLSSYFIDRQVEIAGTGRAVPLKVELRNGQLQLNCGKANYSFGELHEVFQKAFKRSKLKAKQPNKVLILGFGAGSIASILKKEMRLNCSITGVEQDAEVIRLAKKYFDAGSMEQCEIVEADAASFLKSNKQHYDLIAIDLFEEIDVPEKFCSNDFLEELKQHLTPEGLVYFNFVADTTARQERYKQFKKRFDSVFGGSTELVLNTYNRILINGEMDVD